jgi:hypothetical protein
MKMKNNVLSLYELLLYNRLSLLQQLHKKDKDSFSEVFIVRIKKMYDLTNIYINIKYMYIYIYIYIYNIYNIIWFLYSIFKGEKK